MLVLTCVKHGKIEHLLEVEEGDWKGLILSGYFTGGRLVDLARLSWGDIDLSEKTITFVQRKTGFLNAKKQAQGRSDVRDLARGFFLKLFLAPSVNQERYLDTDVRRLRSSAIRVIHDGRIVNDSLALRACLKSRMRGHVIVGVMTISTDVDKLYDTDLTDAAWALIAPMLPAARPGGRPRKINIRAVLNAIFYLLRTGCQWRLLPREFPGWSTVYHYLEERWCLDLYPALNLPASSTASRPGRLSLSRHYGRSVGKDHTTRRHSRIRCAQARERPQAPYFGGHPRAADRMQSGASRHLRPKGGCPVARWPEAIIPEHSHSHR